MSPYAKLVIEIIGKLEALLEIYLGKEHVSFGCGIASDSLAAVGRKSGETIHSDLFDLLRTLATLDLGESSDDTVNDRNVLSADIV